MSEPNEINGWLERSDLVTPAIVDGSSGKISPPSAISSCKEDFGGGEGRERRWENAPQSGQPTSDDQPSSGRADFPSAAPSVFPPYPNAHSARFLLPIHEYDVLEHGERERPGRNGPDKRKDVGRRERWRRDQQRRHAFRLHQLRFPSFRSVGRREGEDVEVDHKVAQGEVVDRQGAVELNDQVVRLARS